MVKRKKPTPSEVKCGIALAPPSIDEDGDEIEFNSLDEVVQYFMFLGASIKDAQSLADSLIMEVIRDARH